MQQVVGTYDAVSLKILQIIIPVLFVQENATNVSTSEEKPNNLKHWTLFTFVDFKMTRKNAGKVLYYFIYYFICSKGKIEVLISPKWF